MAGAYGEQRLMDNNGFAKPFGELETEKFRVAMRPHAIQVYRSIFGNNCVVEDLREQGVQVHVLDKEFGVDTLLTLGSGQWLSIQEKYRKPEFLTDRRYRADYRCPDFTQEYMNGAGTSHEAPGEWFKLGAQLYFYGWATPEWDGFAAWVLMNIPRYKLIVEQAGGLERLGILKPNRRHGSANFYCIPVRKLRKAWTRYYNLDGEELL